MTKYNLSKIMKRAWELVKTLGMTISSGLKEAWMEAKNTAQSLVDRMVANVQQMIDEDNMYVHGSIDRKVSVSEWEKYGKKRAYISVKHYTLAGNYKGETKCGYVDLINNEYVCTKYDDVNAELMDEAE